MRAQKAELETQIESGHDAVSSLLNLERFVKSMQNKMVALDFEGKRDVLDMLNIEVWLDGEKVEITGSIPVENNTIVTTSS